MNEIGVGSGYLIDDPDAMTETLTRAFDGADEFIDDYFTACGSDPAYVTKRSDGSW